MEWVSIRELARQLGVSDTAVHKAIRAGRISQDNVDRSNPARPKVKAEAAKAEWSQVINPNRSRNDELKNNLRQINKQLHPAKPLKKYSNSKGEEDQDKEIIQDDASTDEAKRVDAINKAKLSHLEVMEQRGRLVRRDKVYRELYDIGVSVRSAMQGIPDKIIDSIRACKTRQEAHSLLYSTITEALEALQPKNGR